MPTTYSIAVSTQEVSCYVVGLTMERAIWSGHKFNVSENKNICSGAIQCIHIDISGISAAKYKT